ncbi:BTAD domain-containing putative transcriptional regulator [Streptomyces sp. R44]|uniref:BTAD domain-containing putative transcriptional regulator n=1 Tax=Streptomyces sp. R44 TaxID=3238633 RepID=A0AB39T984_9ACTN
MAKDLSLPVPALRLLGTFGLDLADGGRAGVEAPGQRVLAFLGLNRCTTRGILAGTMWPHATEAHAQGSLRSALWRLRRAGAGVVESRGEVLSLSEDVTVDVRVCVRAALSVVNDAEPRDEAGLGLLAAGDLLPGWDEEWVVVERERLRQLRLHALEALSARLSRDGRHALALDAALICVGIDPLRESAHRAVVAVHLAEHNTAEAVRHYETFRALVREELSIEPSPQFTAMLPPSVLRRPPRLVRPSPPPPLPDPGRVRPVM